MSAQDPQQVLGYDAVVAEEGLDDWRMLYRTLHARFRTGDFATGLALVTRITLAADAADHHPDVVLTYPSVEVRLTSHDVDGVTTRDLALARQISAIATDLEVPAEPSATSAVELALDTPAYAEVRGFWAAVLGYVVPDQRPDEVKDPAGQLPALWFQDAPDASGRQQQRFHLDVMVPPEAASDRIEAALAAGGTLVSDAEAPSFWVLADAHGNRACICTMQAREGSAA